MLRCYGFCVYDQLWYRYDVEIVEKGKWKCGIVLKNKVDKLSMIFW